MYVFNSLCSNQTCSYFLLHVALNNQNRCSSFAGAKPKEWPPCNLLMLCNVEFISQIAVTCPSLAEFCFDFLACTLAAERVDIL